MSKKTQEVSKRKSSDIVILAILGVVLVSGLYGSLKLLGEKRSDRNFEIIAEAVEKKDVSICERIKGGTNKQTLENERKDIGINGIFIPARSEKEAKAECISSVKRRIDNVNSQQP